MPTITLNKQVVEKLLGKQLPLEELKDRIAMLGTDLEDITGDEIHVQIFSQPRICSEQGFVRALSSFVGARSGLKIMPPKTAGKSDDRPVSRWNKTLYRLRHSQRIEIR